MTPRKTATTTASRNGRGSGGRESVGRDAVVQAALQLFLRHGYAGTSMKALAQELGISAPALYWYFPSKDELYSCVIETSMTDFATHVRRSTTESEPRERLSQIVRAHVSWQLQQSDVARVFELTMHRRSGSPDIPDTRLQSVVDMEREYVESIRAVLRDGAEQGVFDVDDVKTTAFAIITLCEYVHTWYNPRGEMSISAVADRYAAMVMRMVEAPTASR